MGAMTTARNYTPRPLRWHEWRDVERGEIILFHCVALTMSPNFPENPDRFVTALYEDNRLADRALAYERHIFVEEGKFNYRSRK